MEKHHNFLHRTLKLLRACHEPVTPDDAGVLDAHGIRASVLGDGSVGWVVQEGQRQGWLCDEK